MTATVDAADLSVELPAGGMLHLQTPEEVDMWQSSLTRYREDYTFVKVNDLFTLGALLQSQIQLFRAQTAINGMVPELDAQNVPTGRYKRSDLDAGELSTFQRIMTDASKEMRALEKQLGIDKATREAGGSITVESYITELKRAAHERGVHITRRTLEYERFVNDLRMRVRMLFNADAQDRSYHNISPKSVLEWCRDQCEYFEQLDIEYAREKGKLFVGKL